MPPARKASAPVAAAHLYCRLWQRSSSSPTRPAPHQDQGSLLDLNQLAAFEQQASALPRNYPVTSGISAFQPTPQPKRGVDGGGFFGPEKKALSYGVIGGLALMGIAVVWFVVGWMGGVIFFYPPILFLIGLFGLVRALFSGNRAGD